MLRKPDTTETETAADKNSEALSFFTSLAPGANAPEIEVKNNFDETPEIEETDGSLYLKVWRRLTGKK